MISYSKSVVYTQKRGDVVITLKIKRTDKETVVKAQTDVEGEKVFTFSLSPIITHKSLKLILPMMIKSEREKRRKKEFRREELKAAREARKERDDRYS